MDVSALNLSGSYMVLETTNRCPLKCGHCAVAEAEVKDAACELPGQPRVLNLEPQSLPEVLDSLREVGEAAADLAAAGFGSAGHPSEQGASWQSRQRSASAIAWARSSPVAMALNLSKLLTIIPPWM